MYPFEGNLQVVAGFLRFDIQLTAFGIGGSSARANVRSVRVDQIFERQARVDEFLDRLGSEAIAIPVDAGRMVGHLVEHLAVGAGEPGIVLEEVAVPIDVGDHQLLVEQAHWPRRR